MVAAIGRSDTMRAIGVAVAVVVAALSAGCSGSPEPEKMAPANQEEVSAPVAEPEPAPLVGFDPQGGPLFTVWAPSDRSFGGVYQFELTGQESYRLIFEATLPAGARPTLDPCEGGAHLSGWKSEQVFDPSWQLIALNWHVEQDDSNHVGWLNADGELVDVTALVTTSGDFAASPQHANALFDRDGNFVYIDFTTKMLHHVDPATRQPVGDPTDLSYLFDGHLVDRIMYMPDGSLSVEGGWLTSSGIVVDVAAPDGNLYTSYYGTRIVDVVGTDRLLGFHGAGAYAASIKVLDAANLPSFQTEDGASIEPITPVTDFKIVDAVSGGSGELVYFSPQRGTEYALFSVPVAGGVEPVRVGDIPQELVLTAWP